MSTFAKDQLNPNPLSLSGEELQATDCVKILGVKISNDLKNFLLLHWRHYWYFKYIIKLIVFSDDFGMSKIFIAKSE